MDNEGNQFIGFMVIMGVTGLLMWAINNWSGDPAVIAAVGAMSPWAAAHINALTWASIAVVSIAGLVLPPILMSRDDGDHDGLKTVGAVTSGVALYGAIAYGIFLLIPSVSFMLGIGWFGAKRLIGQ